MEKEKLIRLVTDAQSGSDDAISEIYNTFHNDIYYIALRETKNPDTALDITQEAFIEIIQTINKLQEPAAFVTWMKAIAYHQCTRYYKKKDVKHELIIDEQEDMPSVFEMLEEENEEFIPDKALDNEDFKETIRNFVGELPEAQRTAIMMKYFDEMSVKQIAEIQGVPENTVLSRLNYGRKAIKSSVEDYEKKHNIKLHAIPFFPLFKWLFDGVSESMSAEAATATAESIAAATGTTITATTTSASVAATTATAVGATAAKISIGAKIASLPLVTKIIVGIIAASIVIGVPTATITLLNNKEPADQNDLGNGNSIVEVSNTIPEGCIYTIDSTGEILTSGMKFPAKPKAGDRYLDQNSGYEYAYKYALQLDRVLTQTSGYYVNAFVEDENILGWSVSVTDRTKSSYGVILSEICGEPVTNLDSCFFLCENMTMSPKINKGVLSIDGAFERCFALIETPLLPEGLLNMDSAFMNCRSLIKVTNIPSTVTDLDFAFNSCTSLTTCCLVPQSVSTMLYTFTNCANLTGVLNINATPQNYDGCFRGTAKEIILNGGCTNYNELRETSDENNITCSQFIGNHINEE